MEATATSHPPILNLAGVEKMTTLSKTTIYRKIKDGDFPKSKKFKGSSRAVWETVEVLNWIKSNLQ